MFVMTGKIKGKIQMTMPVAVMALERWLLLLLSPCIIKKIGFAVSSFSGVCLVVGIEAKLNPEDSCFDNGLDCSLVLSPIDYAANMLDLMPFDMPGDGKCYPGVPNIVSELQRETRLHEISLTDTECHLNNLSHLLEAI